MPRISHAERPPAPPIVQGSGDTVLTIAPATALHQALLPLYHRDHDGARLGMVVVPGMPHGWTDDKTAAAEVRHETAAWFARH